jgi:hypothetical protein
MDGTRHARVARSIKSWKSPRTCLESRRYATEHIAIGGRIPVIPPEILRDGGFLSSSRKVIGTGGSDRAELVGSNP